MKDRHGWFSDVSNDENDSTTYQVMWQPCLQLDGWCPSMPVWFSTKKECDDFIKTEILGRSFLDDEL